MEGVLSSGIVERLCTRIENKSSDVNLLPTLLVLDQLCSGLKSHRDNEQHSTSTKKNEESQEDLFALTRRCGFALALIEQSVLTLVQSLGRQSADTQTRNIQEKIGGMIVRHFRSSIHPMKKEIGSIAIDLAAVRREMEADREKEKREMEDMKRMNEKWIEEGRQREEEMKREDERKRKEEEEKERRRNVKEGAAAIELYATNTFTLTGNVFTQTQRNWYSILSSTFGAVVVRITFVLRSIAEPYFFAGLITPELSEKAMTYTNYVGALKGGAGWALHPYYRSVYHDGKNSHSGFACELGTVGQRVVMEADGREGKRTLRLSQGGDTQPAFISNIPVPFRFVIQMLSMNNSVEIVSSEVMKKPSMVGGSLEVVMD
ncbi:hypothetical protein BLNAU_8684 [Blattamonas nauphoetae]|uniref:Uncharacterized protein n=1 Tax=Blattamonas nauphoetae TaxID=2049346 RepID=A0ABQ9XXX9_9EUKA|nr:hypothetical protein BLNAU_8684 [Blattamonas nauphoetae]